MGASVPWQKRAAPAGGSACQKTQESASGQKPFRTFIVTGGAHVGEGAIFASGNPIPLSGDWSGWQWRGDTPRLPARQKTSEKEGRITFSRAREDSENSLYTSQKCRFPPRKGRSFGQNPEPPVRQIFLNPCCEKFCHSFDSPCAPAGGYAQRTGKPRFYEPKQGSKH